MNIDLEKLYNMQKTLDERIKKQKGLGGVSTVSEKVLALFVELGELANEWRGFKFWSTNQEPRIEKEIRCFSCQGTGDENYEAVQEDAEGRGGHVYVDCVDCNTTGVTGITNPLLEEYVDGIHFFLSLGLDIGMTEKPTSIVRQKTILKQFTTVYILISNFSISVENGDKEEYLRDDLSDAFGAYIRLGKMIGFTGEQVERAYFAKNAVNHERQVNGY